VVDVVPNSTTTPRSAFEELNRRPSLRNNPSACPACAGGTCFKKYETFAKYASQDAPYVENSVPVNTFPFRRQMKPAISCVPPPNISATPDTTGATPLSTQPALTMLSMNVTTAKAVSANGAAFAQLPDAEGLAAALVSRLLSGNEDALATVELPITPRLAMLVTCWPAPGLRTCSGVVSERI